MKNRTKRKLLFAALAVSVGAGIVLAVHGDAVWMALAFLNAVVLSFYVSITPKR